MSAVVGFYPWTVVVGFFLGATIGSFLNMAIYRLPRGISFVNPSRSFCPRCKHPLSGVDLFPLLSWLSTGGKCRYCKEPIAVRYFLVEMLTGILWAGVWWQFLVESWAPLTWGFYSATVAVLVAVIYIDWELYIIPDELNAFILALGLSYHAIAGSLTMAVEGALLGWGLLWGIALLGRLLFGKDAMGHGDIKLMRGIGAVIGPILLTASLAIAVVAGLVLGVTLILISGWRERKAASSGEAEQDEQEGEAFLPESIGSLLKLGLFYLLCLDIFAIFVPKIYDWVGEPQPETGIEEDDWKPGLTTIPFGPYLAIGAIVCMIFSSQAMNLINDWWSTQMGDSMSSH